MCDDPVVLLALRHMLLHGAVLSQYCLYILSQEL